MTDINTSEDVNPLDYAENEDPGTRFNPDDYAWRTHLKKALDDLRMKVPEIDIDWNYYDGIHPRFWLTDTLAKMFDGEMAENMSENWCAKVVEAPVKRLAVTGWTAPDNDIENTAETLDKETGAPVEKKAGTGSNTVHVKAAQNIFKDNDLELEQKEIYRQTRAVGESFAFVWKDDDKEYGIDINIQDARNVWWPKDAKRNDPDRVVQVWMSEDEGIWRATVYYRYVVVRLIGPKINEAKVIPEIRWFTVDDEDPGGIHGFDGKVPVIRFALQRRRIGIISGVRHQQDKINKLVSNKMVTAEFNAFGKTILMTEQEIEDGDLEIRPDRFLKLHPGGGEDGVAPTSVWESTPDDLNNYDSSIGVEIDKLFTMADLPGHMQVKSTREVPSGAAYEADEGPFTEMIADMQRMFEASWIDLYALCGIEVKPQWQNPHVRSDSDEVTTVKTGVEAQIPLRLALKKYAGWSEDELIELDNQPLSAGEQQKLAMAQMIAGVGQTDANAEQDQQTQDQPTEQPKQGFNGPQPGVKPTFGK